MPSKAVPPRNLRSQGRRAARHQKGFHFTPFFWLVTGGIIIVLTAAGFGARWLLARGTGAVTPTAAAQQSVPATATAEILPTATLTPRPTATPIACIALRITKAHAEPKVKTITEPLAKGEALMVMGKIEKEGILWYQVLLSGVVRYIPADDISCPIAP